MPGVSSTTSILPLRVPNELLERLESIVLRLKTTRTEVGREALEFGLQQIEKKLQGPATAPARMLNQKDVKESEVRYLSATFHFLCT
jgi:predicted DNA-binding protein